MAAMAWGMLRSQFAGQLLVVPDGAEGVVHPEELARFVGVPPGDQLTGAAGLDRQAAPVVRGRDREHQGYDGFADCWLAQEQHEPVRSQRLGCLAVWLSDDEGGELVARRGHQHRRLSVGAIVEDLGQVAQAVDAGDEEPQRTVGRDRGAHPLVAEDQRMADPSRAQPVPDTALGLGADAGVGH